MRYWIFGLGLLLAGRLMADFVYEPVTGWKSTDKSFEQRLTQGLENPEALRLMNEAAAIYKAGKIEKARTTYRSVYQHYATSALAPEALYQIAKIRTEQKKIAKAYEAYGHIVGEYPNYPHFDGLLKEMFELAERISVEKTTKVFGMWDIRDRDEAIQAFEKIVTAAPYSDYAPRALFLIAKLYKEKGEELSSIEAYERLIGSYPNHPLAGEAYLALAETYRGLNQGAAYDQGATGQAIKYYQDFIAQYPEDARVAEAQTKLAQMQEMQAKGKYDLAVFYYEKRNNSVAAANLLKEVIQIAPSSAVAQKAEKILERISKEPAKKPAAKKLWDNLLFWKK